MQLLELRDKIYDKINTLTGTWWDLAVVFKYHTLESDGQYPYITFEPVDLNSEFLDTCTNLRSYTFDVFLYQVIIDKDRETATDILYSLFEQVIQMFDEDYTLNWEVDWGIQAVGWEFGQIVYGDGETLFANIKIICKVTSSINL